MLAFVRAAHTLVHRKPSFPMTRQQDSVDCGPTCLQMIAKYYGKTYALQYLRELCYMNRQGVSLLSLSEAAERLGFRTLAAKITLEQLVTQAPLPCIVYWQQRHYIVVYAVKGDRVYTADPAGGLIAYTQDEFRRGWLSLHDDGAHYGVVLLLEPALAFDEQEDEHGTAGGFQLLWSYICRHKKLLVQLFVGVGVASVLQLILPFLTKALVDIGVTHHDLPFVYIVLLAQLVLVFSRTVVDFIQGWIVLHVGTRTEIVMVSDFLSKLMRLPVAFFDAKSTGDLLQRIQDHTRVQTFLSHTSIQVLLSSLSLMVFGVVLAWYSLTIFGIFALGSVLYLAYILVFLKRRRALDYKRFDQLSSNHSLLIEMLHGMAEIKLNNAEQQQRWSWEALQARLFRLGLQGLALDQAQQGGAVCINEIKNVVITVVAAQQTMAGNLSLGTLLAIQYILGQLNGPLNQLITFFKQAQDAKLSLERMHEVRTLQDEETPAQQLTLLPEQPSLHLRGVSFRYGGPHNNLVLEDLALTIPHGKVTALVGSSGSGKTTLLKLLLRFYEPLSGDVILGELNLRHFSHRFWRAQCGVVLQDGQIFSDTIARNIALGEEVIDRARLRRASEVACMHSFIESLPLAYNTKIGGSGIGLSMGQQQRILIARAVYKDPKYLFFDEATSALDAETERAITEHLQRFFEGRTVVVIAHRLSTVRQADQIVVLEHGRIVECGSHVELVALQSRYYHLVKNQLELGK
jgi:ATP-binding cassette subfamily B protein